MSAQQTVMDMLDEWLAAATIADTTPAKAANPAKDEHSCGLQPDSGFREGLRIPANLHVEPALVCADSQTFASIRKLANHSESQYPCGLSQDSQDSQDSQGFPPQLQGVRTCEGCLHRLRAATCAQPEAAGLMTPAGQGFGIAWPPQGHAAECAAFTSKAPSKVSDRPYRLSAAEGDAAHATAWDDASVSLFIRRTERLQRQGFRDSDAEDLAERLHLRDVQQDGRALCLECRYLTGTTATAWRCGNHKSASVPHNLAGDLVTLLQRCPAFSRGSA
jgi:hypothetical protein